MYKESCGQLSPETLAAWQTSAEEGGAVAKLAIDVQRIVLQKHLIVASHDLLPEHSGRLVVPRASGRRHLLLQTGTAPQAARALPRGTPGLAEGPNLESLGRARELRRGLRRLPVAEPRPQQQLAVRSPVQLACDGDSRTHEQGALLELECGPICTKCRTGWPVATSRGGASIREQEVLPRVGGCGEGLLLDSPAALHVEERNIGATQSNADALVLPFFIEQSHHEVDTGR
mmetsp:Transcript_82910/g.149581  ORF Transcript_82910/g.149581 Transcript_82910/m.149581 type:complete len:231 (-) Transcript_82910:635-1327(-)